MIAIDPHADLAGFSQFAHAAECEPGVVLVERLTYFLVEHGASPFVFVWFRNGHMLTVWIRADGFATLRLEDADGVAIRIGGQCQLDPQTAESTLALVRMIGGETG